MFCATALRPTFIYGVDLVNSTKPEELKIFLKWYRKENSYYEKGKKTELKQPFTKGRNLNKQSMYGMKYKRK